MNENLLPQDGHVKLYQNFFTSSENQEFFKVLKDQISWQEKEIVLFGKKMLQPRLIAWFSDPGVRYSYSGLNLDATPWPASVLLIKSRVEEFVGKTYNSALINFYRNERDSMGLHSDSEAELGTHPDIASVSFGADRRMIFRHKQVRGLKVDLNLQGASLLHMKDETQRYWKHEIPKSRASKDGRINITFRKILNSVNASNR